MSNPDHRVHASETFWTIVCCVLLLLAVGSCAAMLLDAYQP